MTDNMIERVAQAITKVLSPTGDRPRMVEDAGMDAARAAIAAMREPTPEMLPAEMYEKTYRHIWQKMISAALGESK